MAFSNQDFVKGLDPSGFSSISTYELGQLVDAGYPAEDKGLIITTTDVNGQPSVPNAEAVETERWVRYLWRRVGATTTRLYLWNPGVTYDATYRYWSEVVLNITPASVTNAMLAGGITFDKINSVSWSSIIGVPSYVTTDTELAGDVTGPLNTTLIANDAVTTVKIKDLNVTTGKLALLAVDTAQIANLAVTAAKIAANTITKDQIANDAVTTLKILDANVTADKLAADAVTTDKIKNLEVTTAKLADDSVTADKLAADAVVAASIVDGSIPIDKLKIFESGWLNIPAAGGITAAIANTLGQAPKVVWMMMKCISTEHNYPVNSIISSDAVYSTDGSPLGAYVYEVLADTFKFRRINSVSVYIHDYTSGTEVNLTPAKWQINIFAM